MGHPPAYWWGEDEDRDLMLGVLKYGYGQYDKIRADEAYCFHMRNYVSSGPVAEVGDQKDETPKEDVVKPEIVVEVEQANGINLSIDKEDPNSEVDVLDPDVMSTEAGIYVWPGASELGVRLRRVIGAFMRLFAATIRQSAKLELKREKNRATQEKKHAKSRDFTRRERTGIYK